MTRRFTSTHSPAMLVAACLFVITAAGARALAPGEVLSHQKISNTEGGFTGVLDDFDEFGASVTALGDLDGDGVRDLAVGTPGDDDGVFAGSAGAVWILFLENDGTVKTHQKISNTEGGFSGVLDDFDEFGASVTALGDLDGDGVRDLAVGAPGDDDGVFAGRAGAVWILFLENDGTVKTHQKISNTDGGFTGVLDDFDEFGASVTALGNLDGDGVRDLAVGAPGDDDGVFAGRAGAVWILFLENDGTVKTHQKISNTDGGFTGVLDDFDEFGASVTALGDLDGDGVRDLAVGTPGDDDGVFAGRAGAVWILFLEPDGTVNAHQKISNTEGGFTGILDDFDEFGASVTALGDLDGDGVRDLAVGTPGDDDGVFAGRAGAVWILFLEPDGTVNAHQKISNTEGGFTGVLDDFDEFGASVTALCDLDGDGVRDLAVGTPGDDDGVFAGRAGAVWILFLDGDPADLIVTADDAGACPGGSADLCASASGGVPPYTIEWLDPDGNSIATCIDVPENGQCCVEVAWPGLYCAYVTDEAGCEGDGCAIFTVYENPTCTGGDAEIPCDGTPIELCSNPSGGALPYTFEWSTGDETECIEVSVPGTYAVTVIDANGCFSNPCTFDVTAEGSLAIGDFVWEDLNGDGCQDPTEPGIEDVIVRLFDDCAGGIEVDSTTTDANGEYYFEVCDGEYLIVIEAPMGFVETVPNNPDCVPGDPAGSDETDSDCVNGEICASPDLTNDCGLVTDDGEGCGLGFWKQDHHFCHWPEAYDPNQPFSFWFEDAFPGKTLLTVLSQPGSADPGPNQLNALGRHTVAALLNAASADVAYELPPQAVIDMFNDVYPGGIGDYNDLKAVFEGFNEQDCPLGNCNGDGNPADLDGDGLAGITDFLILLENWGTAGPGDYDSSDVVDMDDALFLIQHWTP